MPRTARKNPVDAIFSVVTAAASFTVIIFIAAILYELIHESAPAIARFGIWKFLSSTDWNPVTESFGALTNIYGTILTTFLSLLMAVPVAIGIAIFVTEVSPNFLKGPIGVAIELLAAIPSIIYGRPAFQETPSILHLQSSRNLRMPLARQNGRS
jgi:phosphate transport system permease protein